MTSETVIRTAGLYPVVRQPFARLKPVNRFRPATWLVAFVLVEIACQLALLSSAIGPLRQVFRSLAFGVSLLWLLVLYRRGLRHPAAKVGAWALVIVSIQFFHLTTNSWLAGIAQVALYLAIMAPLFWIPSLPIDAAALRRVILILWTFYAVSSAVGVLQVYYPGKFQPTLSTAITSLGQAYVHDLEIQTASGARVFRPMGLTDRPGGAAIAGLYAGLLGLGFLLYERRGLLRWLGVVGAILGLICIYLSQVRLFMIMFVLCALTLCAVLMLRRDGKRLALVLVFIPGVVAVSFLWALALGGRNMVSRMETLVQGRPGEVYYKNRGFYLEHTIQDMLPTYPFGAGLGRWGMMYSYFGNKSAPNNYIWVEIQWTGWLLDGGVPLILAYTAAIGVVLWTALRIARLRAAGPIWIWGAVLLAYDVGVFATTFSASPFIGQEGMEFWLLNAALFVAARTEIAKRRALMTEGTPRSRNGMTRVKTA
jgi:hypothetical protein